MAANYVTPILNQPTDPFLQEQLEEQRRYDEQRGQRIRAEDAQDWASKQEINRHYADEAADRQRQWATQRQDVLYDRGRDDRQDDLEQARDWRQDDLEQARGWQEDDLGAKRDWASSQSEQMATELPQIRDRIGGLQQREAAIRKNLLIKSPGGLTVDNAALERTRNFNQRALGNLKKTYPGLIPDTIPNRGVVMASTDAFLQYLASVPSSDPVAITKLMSDYQREVATETAQLAANNKDLRGIAIDQQQLLQRQSVILQRVEGGGVDYGAFQSGVGNAPANQVAAPGGINAANNPNLFTGAANPNGKPPILPGSAGLSQIDAAKHAAAFSADNMGTATSGPDEMGDAFGNWDSDADNNEAFEEMLNAPAATDHERLKNLDAIDQLLNDRDTAYGKQHTTDYKEADEDWFQFGIPSLGGKPALPGAKWDPSVDEVNALYEGQTNAVKVMRERVRAKREEVQARILGGTVGPANPPTANPPNLSAQAPPAPSGGVVMPSLTNSPAPLVR